MSVKGLTLPEAYRDFQVSKRCSFLVYGHDLIVRRVESRSLSGNECERVGEAGDEADVEGGVGEGVLNSNEKRTIGSVHANNPNVMLLLLLQGTMMLEVLL